MSMVTLPVLGVAASDPAISAAAAQLGAQAVGPRDIRYVKTLRISVTDHCNFRCVYCMPEEGVTYLAKEEVLTYEEMVDVARAAISHGIRNFKLTGGEPLLRKDLTELVRMLRKLPDCGEISLTTNGLLLEQFAAPLFEAGLQRITVSLDTLDAARFREITRTGDLARVWRGIESAEACGFGPIKINTVVMRGYNVDEVVDFARLTLSSPRTIRFIEFMPLGKSKLLMDEDHFVSFSEIRDRIESELGTMTPASRDSGDGPARVFLLPGGRGRIGFIHAMTAPFCSTCNRLRLTPEGQLRSCLFDGGEVDVRRLLRPHTDFPALRQAFVDCVVLKPDQHKNYGNRAMSSIGG